jgi:hypothetical protein
MLYDKTTQPIPYPYNDKHSVDVIMKVANDQYDIGWFDFGSRKWFTTSEATPVRDDVDFKWCYIPSELQEAVVQDMRNR